MPADSFSFHAGDDPAMAMASERARATFGYFWRELSWEQRRVVGGLDLAAVKTAFVDGDVVERMWLDEVTFDGLTVEGTLLNDPQALTTVRRGQRHAVDLAVVDDWMFAMGGVAHGGWTIQVIRSAMGRRDRRAHDRSWGLRFPDEVLVAQGQTEHPERIDDHPMCLNTRSHFAAWLQTEPHGATDVDQGGFTMLQREAIAGNAPLVTLLLAFGADPEARSPRGMTAAEHASALGWDRVVEALRG